MKQLTSITALFLGMVVALASCTKEGPKGDPGINGTDGTVGCVTCHDNSQVIFEKSAQWEASGHATGGNAERNATDCAPCHSSQGFLEVLSTGAQTTAAAIANPMQPNCYACHEIHATYTQDDWKLTNTEPVEFWINSEVSDQGTANMCIGCHQARIPSPMPVVGGTGTVAITSAYWGVHHGPQGPMFAGTGGYEIGTGYTNSVHTNALDNSCVDCHMGEAYGVQAGGHQMGMTYEYHGSDAVFTASCTGCHADATALKAKISLTQTTISTLVDSLGAILTTKGHLSASGQPVPASYTNDEAGIILNYLFVKEDRSNGLHNYNYAKKLLENSIAAAK